MKILIIDDSYSVSRNDAYNTVLKDDFEIEAIQNSPELYIKIEKDCPDLYIVDIVLTSWIDLNTNKPVDTIDVLRKLKPNKPILLISSEYENLVRDNQLTVFMNQLIQENIYVSNFLLWKDFSACLMNGDEDLKGNIIARIQYELLKFPNKPILEKQEIDFGLLTALSTEIEPFLKNIPEQQININKIEGVTFKTGILYREDKVKLSFVCAVQDSMGMVDAALISSLMLSRFNIKQLFMIGVCGGRESQNVQIGDVIVPKESIAYQNGKITNSAFVPDIGVAHSTGNLQQEITANEAKVNVMLEELFNNYQANYLGREKKYLNVKIPVIRYEEMACGDVIVDKESMLDDIAKISAKRKLCAVEMESYSILRTHHYYKNVKASVLKSVMDLTSNKDDAYKDYASYISGNLLYKLIYSGICSFGV